MRVDALKSVENGQNSRENAFLGQNLMKSPERKKFFKKIEPEIKKVKHRMYPLGAF